MPWFMAVVTALFGVLGYVAGYNTAYDKHAAYAAADRVALGEEQMEYLRSYFLDMNIKYWYATSGNFEILCAEVER